jgi:glycosyltransferase involved in cell wall biosynthesis
VPDTNPPRVGVVIPSYNSGAYLLECLQSVVGQSFADWEAIVVDDASTQDDPHESVQRIADSRVRLVRHDANRGLAAARNTGIRATEAPLVLVLDSDDQLDPSFLDATIEALESHQVDCAFADYRLFGGSDEIWRHEGPYTFPSLLMRQTIPGAGVLLRREVWENVGGYDEAAALRGGNEDWAFWIAAIGNDVQVARVPRPLYLYRRHTTSMSASSLRREAHIQRSYIYLQHRQIFDRHRAGGAFLARGYVLSARAAWSNGRRLHAVALSLNGAARPRISGYLLRYLLRPLRGKRRADSHALTSEWQGVVNGE